LTYSILGGLFEDWINTLEPVPDWQPLILPEDLFQDEISNPSPSQTPIVTPENMTPDEEHPAAIPASSRHHINNNNGGASGDSSISEGPSPSAEFGSSVPSPVMPLPTQPGNRGGHQMIIDSANQVIFIFIY
jgi:hypothetical protein